MFVFFGSMSIVGVTQNGNTNILFERKFVIQLLHKILCVHMFAKSPQLNMLRMAEQGNPPQNQHSRNIP
jgi:hypothetical protein